MGDVEEQSAIVAKLHIEHLIGANLNGLPAPIRRPRLGLRPSTDHFVGSVSGRDFIGSSHGLRCQRPRGTK